MIEVKFVFLGYLTTAQVDVLVELSGVYDVDLGGGGLEWMASVPVGKAYMLVKFFLALRNHRLGIVPVVLPEFLISSSDGEASHERD